MESPRIELLIPKAKEVAIDAEIDAFDRFFTELQPDKIGLIPPERSLLRSYFLWRARVNEEAAASSVD